MTKATRCRRIRERIMLSDVKLKSLEDQVKFLRMQTVEDKLSQKFALLASLDIVESKRASQARRRNRLIDFYFDLCRSKERGAK